MAEKVDFYLEQMLPELHDLKEKKLFDESEIREIIRRRTAFEQALIRRVARKHDFTRYAEYEINLEQLRRKRLNRKKNANSKPSISSYSLVKRILHIFDRATKKFKGDVGLWVQYAEVAKREGARKLVSKVLTSALLHHPLSPTLYILLSSHELSENLAPTSARTILQRGLRLIPHSIPLWTEYAKMELVWVERLRRRWDVLGVKDKDLSLEEGGGAGRALIMEGAIVVAVWEGARKALPQSIDLHRSFLTLFRGFPTPLRSALLESTVYTSLRETLGHSAAARSILALRKLEDTPYPSEGEHSLEGAALVDALKVMVDEFKAGAKELTGKESDSVLCTFALTLREWLNRVDDEGLERYLSYHLNQLLLLDNTTPRLHVLHIQHLLSSSSPEDQSSVLSTARSSAKLFPRSPAVTACRLRAELRALEDEPSSDDLLALERKMQRGAELGLVGIPEDDDIHEQTGWNELWDVYFDYLSLLPSSTQTRKIDQLLEVSLRTPQAAGPLNASSLAIHTHLLISSLPLLDSIMAPPPADARLSTLRRFKTRFLPTAEFFEFAFMHESVLPSPRPVLEFVYSEWRAAINHANSEAEIECHLTWLRWLQGEGDAKGIRETLQRLGHDAQVGSVGARVAEAWQIALEEAEEAGTAGAGEDEDVEM